MSIRCAYILQCDPCGKEITTHAATRAEAITVAKDLHMHFEVRDDKMCLVCIDCSADPRHQRREGGVYGGATPLGEYKLRRPPWRPGGRLCKVCNHVFEYRDLVYLPRRKKHVGNLACVQCAERECAQLGYRSVLDVPLLEVGGAPIEPDE